MSEYSHEELLSCIATWKTGKEIRKELENLKKTRISIGVLYNTLSQLVEEGLAISRERTQDDRKILEFQACKKGGKRAGSIFSSIPLAA